MVKGSSLPQPSCGKESQVIDSAAQIGIGSARHQEQWFHGASVAVEWSGIVRAKPTIRRHFIDAGAGGIAMRLAWIVAAAASLIVCDAQAQRGDVTKAVVKTTPLGHDTYMLNGEGGNITLACGKDAAIEVDTEFVQLHDKIKAAIDQACGGKPVKYLINTHFHLDHTGANAGSARDGAVIVGHETLRLRLEHGATNGDGRKVPAQEPAALPTITYSDTIQLMIDGQTALVSHPKNAHTDTDSYVYLPVANVVATGDIVFLGHGYATFDYANGGNVNGVIQAVETFLRMGDAQTRYVPGHGPPATKAELQHYHDLMVRVRDAVGAEVRAGKTEQQMLDDHPLAQIGTELQTQQADDDAMEKMVYRSLTGYKANDP
jgi:glyoxylase-like metal-dependent hydrolase (beta-lactamase superfamily II)